MKEGKKYYVYVYLDTRKKGEYFYGDYKFEYEPFYIGKGTGNRYVKHLTETKDNTNNLFKFRLINKLNKLGLVPIILKIETELSESNAYKLETELIKIIGRRCDKSGSLTNIVTDGKPPSNYQKLSVKTITKIIKLYHEGNYLKHIGNELGLCENKVKRTLIENGITPKRKKPINKIMLDGDMVKTIIKDYENGYSIRKIKEKYSLSFEVVRGKLKEEGIKLRSYDYEKSDNHIKKIWENREHKFGLDNPCYRELTKTEIDEMKRLRFIENKSITYIIKTMNISQKKYYEFINI